MTGENLIIHPDKLFQNREINYIKIVNCKDIYYYAEPYNEMTYYNTYDANQMEPKYRDLYDTGWFNLESK